MILLKDFINKNTFDDNERVIIYKEDYETYEDILVFDDSVGYLLSGHADILNCELSRVRISDIQDERHNHINDNYNAIYMAIIVYVKEVRKVNIVDRLDYIRRSIKEFLFMLPYRVRGLFNKYYTAEWYGDYDELTNTAVSSPHYLLTFDDYPYMIFDKVLIYNESIHQGKYKQPIFRINVSWRVNDNYSEDWDDWTMVFTLNNNPKPVSRYYSYDRVSKRLNGNILPKPVIDELVKFVVNNLDVFTGAWYENTLKFNTYRKGYDESLLDFSKVDFSVFKLLER